MANMNDDKDLMMLDDFFKEATELEIDDNGFTDKVMEVLPSTECKKAENRAFAKAELRWNIICATLAAVLFVALKGWNLIYDVKAMLMVLFHTIDYSRLFISIGVMLLILPTLTVIAMLFYYGRPELSKRW